jgi:hypothetical protein
VYDCDPTVDTTVNAPVGSLFWLIIVFPPWPRTYMLVSEKLLEVMLHQTCKGDSIDGLPEPSAMLFQSGVGHLLTCNLRVSKVHDSGIQVHNSA